MAAGNRLRDATSPYLLQHASNPVDWYPWGDAAFAAARDRDVPIFLSVGYAACHWCHVMERESFEDAETAAFLNEHFVADQGRPRGTPRRRRDLHDGRAGDDRPGRLADVGVPDAERRAVLGGDVLPGHAAARDAVVPAGARGDLGRVADAPRRDRGAGGGASRRAIGRAATADGAAGWHGAATGCGARAALAQAFDERWGGFGGAPKFPQTRCSSGSCDEPLAASATPSG